MLDNAFYFCMTAIVLLSVPIWQLLWKRFSVGSPLLEPRWRLATRIGFVDVCLMFLVWFSSQIAAGLLVSFITGTPLSQFDRMTGDSLATLMLVSGLAQVVAAVGVLIVLGLRYGDHRAVGWQPKFWATDLTIAVAVFLLTTPIMLVAQVLLSMLVEYKHPALDAMFESGSPYAIMAVGLSAVIGAPIAEEVLFRGILQGWFQRLSLQPGRTLASFVGGAVPSDGGTLPESVSVAEVLDDRPGVDDASAQVRGSTNESAGQAIAGEPGGDSPYAPPRANVGDPDLELQTDSAAQRDSALVLTDSNSVIWNWIAIILPSALFALAHIGQGLAPIPLFGLSIVLGYLYQRTGSLLPSIGLHMMVNGYSVVWLVLQICFGQPDSVP